MRGLRKYRAWLIAGAVIGGLYAYARSPRVPHVINRELCRYRMKQDSIKRAEFMLQRDNLRRHEPNE